jgi:hypothetical protein
MGTLSLWQWVMAAIVLFGVVLPGALAACMIWLRRPSVRRPERAGEPVAAVRIALRDGF